MERKATIPVANETESSTIRTTREGRQIKYSLKVIQQPQRARACGAGAKSSADRRPVDPPPIVELKIFEVKPDNAVEDITYMMNANYFLFATLENSRHIAQARGMPEKGPTVLTGTPVAGMVYLDRPTPAGYFIFPDLSVRHEGHYRLSFSLYEELKRPEDADKTEDLANGTASSDSHVTHRLEVKSEPLQVYSAKKFPGLTESTALSRTVAEQGCRVRIRRDVRLRRRDTKPSDGNWDDYEEETSKARARMTATPDRSYGYAPLGAPPGPIEPVARPRSASSVSHQSLAASISRRPSIHDMGHGHYPQQQYGATAPHTPQDGFAAAPFGPSPTQQFSQPPYMQQQQAMQPPPPQYPAQPYQPAPVAQQPSYYGYPPPQAQQQHQYAPSTYETNGHAHRASNDWSAQPQSDYRRASGQPVQAAPAQPQSMYTQPTYPQQSYQQPPPQAYQTQAAQQPQYYAPVEHSTTRAPPLEPVQPPTRLDVPTPPINAKSAFASNTLPPLSNTAFSRPDTKMEPSTPASAIQTNGHSYPANSALPQTPIDSHKRSHGSTFPTQSYQPQKSGARPADFPAPSDILFAGADGEDDDYQEIFSDAKRGMYKRADGTYASRPGVRVT